MGLEVNDILMIQSPLQPVFHTWREHWASLDGLPHLLKQADAVLQRRAAGNQHMPDWPLSAGDGAARNAIHALRGWANGKPPKDTAKRPDLAGRIHKIIQPAINAAGWARWLLLEHALLDASATGDLSFAAVTLRTMCEEIQRLHALDLDADHLAHLTKSRDPKDCERLNLFISLAWVSFDKLSEDMILDKKSWPSLQLMEATMPELDGIRQALNNYVHPNYGNHIASLFPERTGAARLLLKALITIYEKFFELSWAEDLLPGRPIDTIIGPLESWPCTVHRFQASLLPELQRKARDSFIKEVMEVPSVTAWLTSERDDLEALLQDATTEEDAFLEGLPRQPTQLSAAGTVSHNYRLWDGASALDVLIFASARTAERKLAQDFPLGMPDKVSDRTRWYQYNALLMQLTMLVDQVKTAATRGQLLRQVTRGNSLGTMLCVRLLIEYRALAVWLSQQVGNLLKTPKGNTYGSTRLPEKSASELEKLFTKFLGLQGTESEEQRPWIKKKNGPNRNTPPNFKQILNVVFEKDDRLHTYYALASAALHGRSLRGYQLAYNAMECALHTRFLGLLALERFCRRDEEMDYLGPALCHFVKLSHVSLGRTLALNTEQEYNEAVWALFRQPDSP